MTTANDRPEVGTEARMRSIATEPKNAEGSSVLVNREALAREVHAAWRDGMLAQGRDVAPHRMTWETLSPEDHALDAYIADRVAAALRAALETQS